MHDKTRKTSQSEISFMLFSISQLLCPVTPAICDLQVSGFQADAKIT